MLLVAVQVHPPRLVTATIRSRPARRSRRRRVDVTAQPPAWLTVNVWPPIVSVPVRGPLLVLAAALKLTVPLPLPLAPDVIVSQASLLVAVHAQPPPPSRHRPVPPAAGDDGSSARSIVSASAPAWLTVKVWPPIVSVPVRACCCSCWRPR